MQEETNPPDATMCEGLWRSGKLLCCRHDTYFPDRCVRSNHPVGPHRFKLKLTWNHPLSLLLAGHASVRRKLALTATLQVGLCSRCRRRIKRIQFAVMIWLAASLAALLTGILWKTSFSEYLMPIGGLSLVFGFVFDRLFGRVLVVKEINSRYIWLRGASPDFLATLPPWPSNRR
jgi:hypothetical protein